MDLKELGLIDPFKHWYYRHKVFMLMTLYNKFKKNTNSIIEVGSGSGFFCKKFFNEFSFRVGYCVDLFYDDSQLNTTSSLKFQKELPSQNADLYLYIDVLEHVQKPTDLLKETVEKADSGAIYIISVPAFNFLWSKHDDYLGHVKRYTLKEIENICLEANLKILEKRYIFAPIFPLVFFARKFSFRKSFKSDMREYGTLTNRILENLLKLERYWRNNKIFGTSAVIIAVKS